MVRQIIWWSFESHHKYHYGSFPFERVTVLVPALQLHDKMCVSLWGVSLHSYSPIIVHQPHISKTLNEVFRFWFILLLIDR